MSHRRARLVSFIVATGALAGAAPATAAVAEPLPPCGTPPEGELAPAKASLTLADADRETLVSALYGRRTGERKLTLVYTARGCKLTEDLAVPADPPPIGPSSDPEVDTIAAGVIRLDGKPEIDGDRYVVHLKVSTSPASVDGETTTFAPGTYSGFVRFQTPWMQRTVTPVAISRSENRWWKVMILAAIGSLGGFLFFWLLHALSDAQILGGRLRVFIAGAVSVAIGAGVAYRTNYLNQDVWTFSANGFALCTAAFTAATSGPLVTGVLGKVYDNHQDPAKDSLTRRGMNRISGRGADAANLSEPS